MMPSPEQNEQHSEQKKQHRIVDYLKPPSFDTKQLMMTPPMPALLDPNRFPAPISLEGEPTPEELTGHDRAAPKGMVSVSDGTYVEQSDTEGLCRIEGQGNFKVTRRKIIKYTAAPTFVIDLYTATNR